jgi:hypothetical protein
MRRLGDGDALLKTASGEDEKIRRTKPAKPDSSPSRAFYFPQLSDQSRHAPATQAQIMK